LCLGLYYIMSSGAVCLPCSEHVLELLFIAPRYKDQCDLRHLDLTQYSDYITSYFNH
jgi:hypothetical protein